MENPQLTYLSRCGLPVTLILASGISSPAATPVVVSSGGYNDGMPHVLVFKPVRSTGAISLYVDGLLAGTAEASTASLTSPPRLTLGAQQSGVNYFPR
jgi:hypothetical protein